MKTKKSIWSIALSLVMVFALILGISLNTQAKTVQAENEEHITFDVRVDTVESKSVPAGYAGALEVTYTVTETTGVDALQLRLGYDHDAFTLDSVVTNNATTLGTATKGEEDFIENVVYENTNTEDATFIVGAEDENVLLITATFYLNQPTPATAYTFSIYNANSGNDYSNAWRINKAEDQSATHTPVEIIFANEAVVYVQGTYDFTLTGNTKIYDGAKAQDSEITITATGTNAPTLNLVWFDANYNKLEENPTNVGTYYVVAETEGNAYWQAYAGYTGNENDGYTLTDVEGKVATYTITPQTVNVTIDNKSSAYGEALVALTHNGAEYLGINLSTTADNTVPGTYPITGTASNANYTVNFTNGTYTVTAKNINIIIADKTSKYGEATVELTYTVDENTPVVGNDDLHIQLSTTATSSSNVGTYPITGTYDNAKYVVTFKNTNGTSEEGTYTITSVGKDADYVKSFFSGATVEFDAASHNLLIVDANKPDWIGYNAENNNQTNANTYQITVNILVSAQDAKNYIDATLVGDQNYVATVEGKITPKAIVVTADNKSHVYGQNPETLTPATVGLNNEVTVIFTVKDANEETIELSKTTPVGEYAIVPSANNSNYTFNVTNGTYKVTKADAVITVSAEDVFYNRGYNYSATAKANDVDVAKTVVVKDANGNVVDTTSVLDAGTYTVEVTVEGTDNYNGAVETKTFEVKKIAVAAPTVTYNGSTATWTVVENDAGAENVTAKALYNSDVTYTIGENEYSNREFTPSAAGNYTLVITPSNNNYTPVEVELATVYSVTFTEGSHPASTATAANMPGAQYVFNGQLAVEPEEVPTLVGYTFEGWDFEFETEISENTEIPALWTINQITMTVVYIENVNYTETSRTFQADYNSEIAISTYNLKLQTGLNGDNDNMATAYNLNGMHYEFNNLWSYKVTGEDEYIETEIHQVPVNATQPYTFVAVYTATPIDYEITYMLKIDNGSYTQYGEVQTVAYNAVINYANLENVAWFRAETWYTDGERTISAPANMPAGNLTVYGAYVFNIGLGDVNGNGRVTADDITLYRKWIVGGYEIAEVASGNEYALATSNDFNANNTYFLTRVADDNAATLEATVLGDTYLDIRDVSTIRMAMVGGYGFSILEGNTVDGEGIYVTRTIAVESASDLLMVARSGQKVELNADINEPNFVAVIEDAQKDIIIDLKGHTLNLKSFRVTLAEGNTGKILITNGRINVADGNGVYLTAVDGSVHLDNVTLYDDNGQFVIQTANHSLHLFNVVKFLKKDVNAANNEAPAEVLVVKDTHIVVEETAELEIAKVVVAEKVEVDNEEQVVPVAENSDAEITMTIKNEEIEEIQVDGNFSYEISNLNELVAAASKGGDYKLVANIAYNGTVAFVEDAKINLNGYTIRSANSNAFAAANGATLTIEGNGNIEAQEVCVLVLDGSKAIINGGEYTSHDNFVVGTNGSTGRGNNVITINDGIFNGNITTAGYVACGIYVANNDTVVVNGGTFNITNGVGILARSGNTTVAEDVVFNVTGNGTLGKVGDSKVTVPSGEELVIDYAANYPGGTPVLINNSEYEVYVIAGGIANQEQLLNAVANGGQYKVVADFEVNQQVTIEKDFTLDGDNHTITFNKEDNNYYAFYIVDTLSAINVDFSDVTINSTGYQVALMINADNSTLNLTNVDITCDGECVYSNGHAVANLDNCNLTRNNEYTANKDKVYYSALLVGYSGTINVKDSTIVSDRNAVSTFPSGGTINLENTDVTANGDGYAIWARSEDYHNLSGYNTDSIINIKSGNVTGTLFITNKLNNNYNEHYTANIVITGGTFNNDPTAYVADKHYVEENNGVYTVKEYTTVSTVAEIAAVRSQGGFYQLGADIVYGGQLSFTADTTINLNGHKLQSVNNSALSAANGATLTIEGNGNVEAQEVCVLVLDGSEAVINGGEYTSHDNFVVGTNGSTGRGNNVITINDGIFNGNITTAGYVACGIYVANNDTVNVNGGSFNIINGVGILARSGNTTVAEDVVFNVTGNGENGKVGDSRVVIPSGEVLVIDYAANYPGGTPVLNNNNSAEVYAIVDDIASLDAAVENANYIVLSADIDYSTTYTERNARDNGREHIVDLKDITLDLNGHTISTINGTVEFSGNGAIIKNGTFNLVHKSTTGDFQYGSYALIIDNNNLYGADATVTVENVTCNGAVNVCSATVILNNVSAQTTGSKYYTVWAETNANVTINSGNYIDEQAGGKGVLATGTGAEGGATITINGGTFTANNKLVYNAEANSIQIKGGTFTKDPTTYVAEGYYAAENDGVYTVNAGITGSGQDPIVGPGPNPSFPF